MAYSELVKNFNKIREYMRDFYVYGFKSRDEFTKKSARSYDDERRRAESWFGDYMKFRQTPDGKNVFLSIDSRVTRHDPLYKAWKTKSFTDGDITLHFILFDILSSPEISLSLNEITDKIDDYISGFDEPKFFDDSTVRKKLKEYTHEGLILTGKHGKTVYYRRAEDIDLYDKADAVNFFSEVAPCGVIGSFLLDKINDNREYFAFKHHYITSTLDSDILCSLFTAMNEKRNVTLETIGRRKEYTQQSSGTPLRIMISVQSGRQYLMFYTNKNRITSLRTDSIISVKTDDICPEFDEYRKKLDRMLPFMWGVSTNGTSGKRMEHVEFTIKYTDNEPFIPLRLEREKRCGTVEHIDKNTSRFSADLYDASEIVPWMRTFICRITSYSFSDKNLEIQFGRDIEDMYKLYGMEGGDEK